MTKKPTIHDVAKRADVSPATVSYVINGINKVSGKTKEKVLSVIKELNYYPDFTAVSLSKRKSNLIGVISPIEDELESINRKNHYNNELTSGIEWIARQYGFDILITGIENPEECRRWIKKRNLDGVVFTGDFPDKKSIEKEKFNIPVVLVDVYENNTNEYHSIWINDELGAYLATKHLVDLGHKNIALVITSLNYPINQKRFQGYQRALKEANIPVNKKLIFKCKGTTLKDGFDMGEKIVNSKEKITAIFAVADSLALGMIKAFKFYQKQVPEDYSIVGFDDLEISKYTMPGLTTIRQDVFNKGVLTAKMLIEAIESSTLKKGSIELPVQLIVRESTRHI